MEDRRNEKVDSSLTEKREAMSDGVVASTSSIDHHHCLCQETDAALQNEEKIDLLIPSIYSLQRDDDNVMLDKKAYDDENEEEVIETTFPDHLPENEFETDYEISYRQDEEEEYHISSNIYSRTRQRRSALIYNDYYRRHTHEDDGSGATTHEQLRTFGKWEPWDEVCAEDLIDQSLTMKKSDVSRMKESESLDLQGIPWAELPTSREQMRISRLNSYKNYENLPSNRELLQKEIRQVDSHHEYYRFKYSTMKAKSMIVHFQLRNLIWATSKHEVYYTGKSLYRVTIFFCVYLLFMMVIISTWGYQKMVSHR
jgi:hypothetical protein